jgi:hypothetical protein
MAVAPLEGLLCLSYGLRASGWNDGFVAVAVGFGGEECQPQLHWLVPNNFGATRGHLAIFSVSFHTQVL